MSALFPFELISPEKLIIGGEALSVQLPGSEGDFEVLAQHAPLMSALRPGIVTLKTAAEAKRFFINGGFADVTPTGLTVLAQSAVAVEDLNAARLAQAIEAAEKEIACAVNDDETFNAQQKRAALRHLQGA